MPTQRRCGTCGQLGHNKNNRHFHPFTERSVVASNVVAPNVVESDTCPICMENLGKTNCCTTSCGHQFCLECMFKHSKTKTNCPLCRANLPGACVLPDARLQARQEARQEARQARRRLQQAAQLQRVQRVHAGFRLRIDNHTTQTYDAWWLPSPVQHNGNPLRIHRNIVPGSSRTLNVGNIGDRFVFVNEGEHVSNTTATGHFITTNRPHSHYILTDENTVVEVN